MSPIFLTPDPCSHPTGWLFLEVISEPQALGAHLTGSQVTSDGVRSRDLWEPSPRPLTCCLAWATSLAPSEPQQDELRPLFSSAWR